MDILSVVPRPVEVTLRHPGTKAPIGVLVECVSLDDDRCKSVDRAYREKFARLTVAPTFEQIDERNKAMLAAAITGWVWDDGLKLGDLANPPLTAENKAKLLTLPWVAKQIDAALGDEAAFFQTSNGG